MTRRLLAAAGAVLLLAGWAAAAAPADDVQDVTLLADGKPLLVRLHLQVDGKPFRVAYREAWDDYLGRFFKYLDADGDGVLSAKEAERMPPPLDLSPDSTFRATNVAFNVRVVDADGDGKITFAELAAFQREYGVAPVQLHAAPRFAGPLSPENAALAEAISGPARVAPPSGLNEAIFAHLDTDKDGKLSKEELAAAATVLFALDRDRDDLLTVQELLGVPSPPTSAIRGGGGSMSAPRSALRPISLVGDDAPAAEPAVELVVRLGKIGDAKPLEILPTAGKAADVGARLADDGTLLLTAKGILFELRVNSGRPALTAGARQGVLDQFRAALPKGQTQLSRRDAQLAQFFPAQFSLLDRNGDDKLTEEELLAFLDGQDRLARAVACTPALLISDRGVSLFDLLDRDRDGRLSQREVRDAPRLLARLGREGQGALTREDVLPSYQLAVGLGRAYFTKTGGAITPRGMPTLTLDWSRPELLWFSKMDRNHDGDLSPREFLGPRDAFRKIDADGDGLISLEEALKADTLFRKQPAEEPKGKDDELSQAFQKAREQVAALERKHTVLEGLSQVKPQVDQDAKGLKQASVKFEKNTAREGKPPPPAKDASQPHFYLAVSLWRGEPTQQPPAGIQHFRVQGADYYLIVTVRGSDPDLVKQVRTTFEDAFLPWTGPQPPGMGPK